MVKKYYENMDVKFEGEYLNNEKWNGKEYDKDGNLIFEGKYLSIENGIEKNIIKIVK